MLHLNENNEINIGDSSAKFCSWGAQIGANEKKHDLSYLN